MSSYFEEYEIACPCCNEMCLTPKAVNHLNMLNVARYNANIPFNINSWNRCEKHNKEVSGSPTSSHLKGIATDISFKDMTELFIIVNSLMLAGFKRILIYPKSWFIHVDSDSTKTYPVLKVMEQE